MMELRLKVILDKSSIFSLYYLSGYEAHKGHYHHNIVPEPSPHHHHHHGHHDEWTAPYEHAYEKGSGPWDNPAEHDTWDKWHHDWEHGLD